LPGRTAPGINPVQGWPAHDHHLRAHIHENAPAKTATCPTARRALGLPRAQRADAECERARSNGHRLDKPVTDRVRMLRHGDAGAAPVCRSRPGAPPSSSPAGAPTACAARAVLGQCPPAACTRPDRAHRPACLPPSRGALQQGLSPCQARSRVQTVSTALTHDAQSLRS
jgi:hypothetical protein